MGRTLSQPSGSASVSNNVLLAKASRFQLAINDLLYMAPKGDLYPAQSMAWAGGNNAGSALLAETTVSAGTAATAADVRQAVFIDPTDQSIFTLTLGASLAQVSKYTPTGALIGTVSLDTTSTSDYRGAHNIIQLSNGQLAIFWSRFVTSGTVSEQSFAIIDTNLNVIVPKTAMAGPAIGGLNTNSIHASPLTGGGFAVAISAMTSTAFSIFFGIYTNAGVAVRASAAIAGTSQLQNGAKCVQLSSGDILIAITSSAANQAAAIATFTTAGAAGIPFTVIDASTSSGGFLPEISVLPGFVAIGTQISTTAFRVSVINNAGALQGTVLAGTTVPSGVSPLHKIRNDGTYFWTSCLSVANVFTVTRLPTTGAAAAVASTLAVVASDPPVDFFIERDMMVFAQSTRVYAFTIRADGTLILLSAATAPTTLTASPATHTFKPSGDFTMAVFSPADATNAPKVRVWRYLDVCLIGVSNTAVAAGNAGALISVSTGPVAQQINPLPGPASRTFDHSGGNLVGNKGFLLQNSVALKGY